MNIQAFSPAYIEASLLLHEIHVKHENGDFVGYYERIKMLSFFLYSKLHNKQVRMDLRTLWFELDAVVDKLKLETNNAIALDTIKRYRPTVERLHLMTTDLYFCVFDKESVTGVYVPEAAAGVEYGG